MRRVGAEAGGKLSQVGVSVCSKTGIASRAKGGIERAEGEGKKDFGKNNSGSTKAINSKPFNKLSA